MKKMIRLLVGFAFLTVILGCSKKETKVSVVDHDMGNYYEESTLPRYPGSFVEYSEKVPPSGDFVALLRIALQTKDPMDKVKSFYLKEFEERYGEPTERKESERRVVLTKSKDHDSDPYFSVEITDLGAFRRIIIIRSDRNR